MDGSGLGAGDGRVYAFLQCRFCLEDAPASALLAPCNCTGTSRYVHGVCLRLAG